MWHAHIDTRTHDLTWRDAAAAILARGGVIAYPTDTLYGLAADPRSEAAIEKLYRIKGRPVDLAMPLIAADEAQLFACGATLSVGSARLAARFWPGPLTLILAAWNGLAPAMLAGGDTVAVRVPDHPTARALAAACGHPVTATSANRSGRPATAWPAEVIAALGADLDGILDAGPCTGGAPSTIVDARFGPPKLVRTGAIAWERVLEFVR